MPVIQTEHLILRPWREEDAEELYRWASDPEVGPAAGWAPHESVEDSLNVLRTILMKPDTWALCLKGTDAPIGSIGAFPCSAAMADKQPEIGYWLARPYWGQGLMPEAVRALIALLFERGAREVWCAHAVQNHKSRRVIEKCGFRYQATESFTGSDGVTHPSLYYLIDREDWKA